MVTNLWDDRSDEISEEESKKALEDLNKQYFPSSAQEIINSSYSDENISAQEMVDITSKNVKFKPPTPVEKVLNAIRFNPSKYNNYSQRQQEVWNAQKIETRNPNIIKEIGFGKSPSLTKRGAKVGQRFTMHKPKKWKYERDEFGRSTGKKVGRNPAYDEEGGDYQYRYNKKTGRWQYRRNPSRVKRVFSKISKELQPKRSQSEWEKKRMTFYQQQQQNYFQGYNQHNYPFTEDAIQTNKNRADYLRSLENSQANWLIHQQQHNQRLAIAKKIIQQEQQNMLESSQLKAFNMFSSENQKQNQAVDIFQSDFSNNPNAINLLKQREDSISILDTKGKPNILQSPENILSTPNIFSQNQKSIYQS